jgi:hypothetical protein
VRRGRPGNGLIYVNGHPPIPALLAGNILDLLKRVDRPMTSQEIAAELHYTRDHIRNVCQDMTTEKMLTVFPGWSRVPSAYALPGHCGLGAGVPTKRCAKCGEDKPWTGFQRDRAQSSGLASRCRQCRSPKADKSKVLVYPSGRG